MSYDRSDYEGITNETERRDALRADERREDERREALERERAFVEYAACVNDCFETGTHRSGCEASGAAPTFPTFEEAPGGLVAIAVDGWLKAVTRRAA